MNVANRVRESANSPGVGDVTLDGPAIGHRTFNLGYGIDEPFTYMIDNQLGNWEVGKGHLSDAVTLVRDTVEDNSLETTAKINFSGVVQVFSDLSASDLAGDNAGAGLSYFLGAS